MDEMTPGNRPQWGEPGPYPTPWWVAPPPPQPPRRPRTRWLVGGLVGGLAAVVGVGLGVNSLTSGGGNSQLASSARGGVSGGQSGTGPSGTGQGGNGQSGSGPFGTGHGGSGPWSTGPWGTGGLPPGAGSGNGGSGNGGGGSRGTSSGTATAAQQVGVVDIDTVLKYQGAEAAGTGMILSSSGEVLTNNHVVDGATSIRVTVVSTGVTYTASVVGTDPTDDVAVIQLQGASGLQKANTDSSSVSVGDSVVGVGNAGGVGGTPSAAQGTVLATGQSITASDENGANPETLHGLIETDAPIAAGDSGGPLYNSHDQVVGMDTAASTGGSGGRFPTDETATATTAYAIPIDHALSIANKIESGQASSTIHLGYPGFLGVQVQGASGLGTGGAAIAGVVPGTPAAGAGLGAGDVITAVDGHAVASADDLSSALAGKHAGDRVTITWTGATGQSQSATVTLAQGPAD